MVKGSRNQNGKGAPAPRPEDVEIGLLARFATELLQGANTIAELHKLSMDYPEKGIYRNAMLGVAYNMDGLLAVLATTVRKIAEELMREEESNGAKGEARG